MGKFLRASGAVVVAVVLAGCWPHAGHDAGRSYWNPGERALTVATVGELGELWRTPVHPGTRLKEPASLAGSVYVPGFSGQLARVKAATGAVVWRRTLDAGAAPEPSELSSPVLFGDALRVSWSCCRAGVAGTFWVDPKTGADVPMPPGGAAGYAQPAVAGGKLAGFMTVGGGVYHLNWGDIGVTAASGDDGGQVGFDFAIAGGLVHWPYGRWAQAFSGCHPQDDEYHPCAPDWRTDLGAVPGPPAAVGPDAVAYPVGTGVTVLDRATGAVRWRATGLGARVGTLAVAGPTILAPTDAGEVVALPAAGCGAATCAPLWWAPVGGLAKVAAGGDVAYVTAGGNVIALAVDGCGAPTCAPLAQVHVGGTLSSPVVDGGRVFVGDLTGNLVALGLPR